MAVTITFKGGGGMNIAKTTLGHPSTLEITFPLNEPVTVDPGAESSSVSRAYAEHIIKKARINRFFEVKDGKAKDAKPAEKRVQEPEPEETEAVVDIPEDWRAQHHSTTIALAHKLGADEEVNTLAEATEFIEAEIARRSAQ